MKEAELLMAARFIVARNVTPHIRLAVVSWLAPDSKLLLHYYTYQQPTEQDIEEAEIAMTELIAEFPDVLDCETSCTQWAGTPASGHIAFSAAAA